MRPTCTWSDDPAHAHREIDIEFSRWGDPSARRSGLYAIQTGVHWSHAGPEVPTPGDETPRINLWLYGGRVPTAGALSAAVSSFSFTPLT